MLICRDYNKERTEMLGKILVPLDGSRLAEQALPHAEFLARLTGARLILVRYVPGGSPQVIKPIEGRTEAVLDAQEYLDDVRYELTERGHVTRRGIAAGPTSPDPGTAEWILEQVRSQKAELVVMATNNRSGLRRMTHGSVTETVVACSPVPVMLVRAWDREPPRGSDRPRLLVPLDGSPMAERALHVARELTHPIGAEFVLVYAVPRPVRARGRLLMMYSEDEYAALKSEARQYMDSLVSDLAIRHEDARVDVRGGDPTMAILAAAREHNVTLVVMTTRGRTGISRTVLGSVAGGVLRRGRHPLLLVGPRVKQEAVAR